ncbi:hypothetical protein PGT21_003807 [Puccinia graminis f. sp. tritici]|uniref:Uncharacterized protein n=1 Tax=Puccinia graminis f. sp. tritici TaxID=56615 RepID=A0A5B0QVK1_PUCGR|nr:hypothetical protein PGT21_003807 [Puccinia graminis f. sp. tritici]
MYVQIINSRCGQRVGEGHPIQQSCNPPIVSSIKANTSTDRSSIGCRFIDEPLSINSDGSITVNFTNTNVPLNRRSYPAQYPQFSLTAKPMSLASLTGGPWLIYYGTVDLSSNLDVIKIKSHVSYWQNSCPSFMRCDGGPQLSGNIKFSNTHDHQLCATPLTPSPVNSVLSFHSVLI